PDAGELPLDAGGKGQVYCEVTPRSAEFLRSPGQRSCSQGWVEACSRRRLLGLLSVIRNRASSSSLFRGVECTGFTGAQRGCETMDFRVTVPKIRIVPSPEARLRTLSHGADHAEALAKKVLSTAEPLLQRLYALRTRIATCAVSILAIWLFAHVMFGSNG